MQTVETIPGKTYAVESAGEVIITNTETGAIAAQGDGSGQVLFTACANSYTVSDDTAKIVALFKLAPRLRLALLQGGAGGWLPKGFTELEYLESPSTPAANVAAYFALPISSRVGVDSLRVVSEHFVPDGQHASQMEGVGVNNGTFTTFAYSYNSQSFFISFDGVVNDVNPGQYDINCFFECPQGEWVVYDSARTPEGFSLRLNGELVVDYPVSRWANWTNTVFGCFGRVSGESFYPPYGMCGRKKWWKLYINDNLVHDLIPALDPTGAPGFYDKANKIMYYNAGAGDFLYPETVTTYGLRRVAPYVPEFAQLTPRGVRRLYRVPDDYAGSIAEYAASHGYKRLMETEQPAEGHWSPVWRETEEELRLEWREMPEPQEDELLTE